MEPARETPSIGVLDDNHHERPVHPASDVDNNGRRYIVVPLRWLAVGAVVVVLASLAAWLGWLAFDRHQTDVAAAQALDAAKAYTLELCNIDADTVDEKLDNLRSNTTKQLNALHAKDAARIRQVIVNKKVTAHGTIAEATVQSASRDRVTVLLLVDQTINDVDNPDPDIERNHVKLTMDKVDGRWLASDIEL